MLSRNTHTNTYTHGFLSPSSLSLFLFFLFFLPSSLPSSSSTTRKGRETVGYDGWPWWIRVPRLFVHWNYVGLSSNEEGGNQRRFGWGKLRGWKGRSIERVKWIVATVSRTVWTGGDNILPRSCEERDRMKCCPCATRREHGLKGIIVKADTEKFCWRTCVFVYKGKSASVFTNESLLEWLIYCIYTWYV